MTSYRAGDRLFVSGAEVMSMTTSTGELVDLVIEEIWNQGELERANELFTSDYVNHGGVITDMLRGPEAVKLSVALFRSAYPGFHVAVHEVTAEGSAIVVRWVAHQKMPSNEGPASTKRGL